MKTKYFYLIFLFFLLSANPIFAGKCTGSSNCSACSTCSSCAHCNSGGSCGVCDNRSGLSFGKTVLFGGGIVFILWIFIDNSNKNK